jgi:hypothetical protein
MYIPELLFNVLIEFKRNSWLIKRQINDEDFIDIESVYDEIRDHSPIRDVTFILISFRTSTGL